MKKAVKIFVIFIFTGLIMLGLLYAGLAYYYKDTYLYGTYINDVYCTGKTPEEVNAELNELADRENIVIKISGNEYSIDGRDIAYNFDFLLPLKTYKYSQNPLMWILSVGNEYKNVQITPFVSFDEGLLKYKIEDIAPERIGSPHICRIEKEENGYVLNNNKDKVYDPKLCYERVKTGLVNGETVIEISDECYGAPQYSSEDLKAIKIGELLNDHHDNSVVLRVGDEVFKIDEAGLDGMLATDEEGYPIVSDDGSFLLFDRESVHSGLDEVLAPFNSYNNHYFTTHDGRIVHLTEGTLGNSVDVDKAADEVYEKLSDRQAGPVEVEVAYKHKMDDDEEKYASDIGNTYIEISLDEQHMYYYKNGMLQLDTNVVTGKTSAKCDTKEGVYYVYYKQKNRTLIGETYRSFVKYWMAFNRHVGIHDASWRKNWAEDAYIREGSHGCVNTPEEKAAALYDMIDVGIPVIVYSYENSLYDDSSV